MLSTVSPLNNVTNRAPFEATTTVNVPPAAVAAPCFLSLLAEASLLEEASSAKKAKMSHLPAPLQCAESLEGAPAMAIPLETSIRHKVASTSRPSSANGPDSSSSSRSTSPGVPGRSYRCKACGREYASTDAVRKHARQNHTEWLREMGQGSPLLYCTPIDNADKATMDAAAAAAAAFPTVTATAMAGDLCAPLSTLRPETKARISADLVATPPPLATFSSYQHTVHVLLASKNAAMLSAAGTAPGAPNNNENAAALASGPIPAFPALTPASAGSAGTGCSTPLSPGSSNLLMTAAESCIALSLAAGRANMYASAEDDDEDGYAAFHAAQRWGGPSFLVCAPRKGGGMKRPRSVRCGKCDGCERDDCGTCKNCVDKPKFGGIGQRKQGCIRKLCRQPRPAP